MFLLCLLSAGCGKGTGGGTETAADTQSESVGNQETEGKPSGTEESQPAPAESTGSKETEESKDSETEPSLPPVDEGPWDGVSSNIRWYILGDPNSYEIRTAKELKGLSELCESGSSLQEYVFYDDNYDVIHDLDGDGDLTDEEGYNADNVIIGERFDHVEILLLGDIDLNGKPFRPIGASGTFDGYFMGNGHTISNFTVDKDTANSRKKNSVGAYYGLFAGLSNGAEVNDLTIADATFIVDSDRPNLYVGAIAGTTWTAIKIQNVNIVNVTITFETLGSEHTYFGYAIGGLDNVNALVQNVKTYQFTVDKKAGEPDAPTVSDWTGNDSTKSVQPIDCGAVNSDPRK